MPKQSDDFEEIFWYIPKTKLREAAERLDRYIELTLRIYEWIRQDPVEYEKLLEELRKRKESQNDLA